MSALKSPTSLLSAEDLFCIAHQGAPSEIRHDLVHVNEDGSVVLTMRGIQFYKHAILHAGIDARVGALRTQDDIHRLHVDLGTAAYSRQVARLDRHVVNALSTAEQARALVQVMVAGALNVITQGAARLRPS